MHACADRVASIIIYTNLELKTKFLYKNKWKQKPAVAQIDI